MQQLRQAAARERRAPIYWWLLLMVATGGALLVCTHQRSPAVAVFLGILLAAAWAAPLVALHSLAAPPRARKPAPAPGTGSFADWLKQARMLGRVLLYYQDNPELPPDVQGEIRAAREDLRDVLRAHPLRDDLERVCVRVRGGAIRLVKDWFAREYRRDIRELTNEYEQAAAAGMDADKRMVALRQAVEKAAALMSRNCMPRMLERERLACAVDCAWLAVQGVIAGPEHVSPVDLVEMLVIEWSDFSEPWLPATALRRALARLDRADARPAPEPPPAAEPVAAAAAPECGAVVVRNGKRYRRVRVRRKRRHSHRHFWNRGPSLADVFVSFGQWVRYSIRAWMLYR
jgi:hypothetical protein